MNKSPLPPPKGSVDYRSLAHVLSGDEASESTEYKKRRPDGHIRLYRKFNFVPGAAKVPDAVQFPVERTFAPTKQKYKQLSLFVLLLRRVVVKHLRRWCGASGRHLQGGQSLRPCFNASDMVRRI